jgi:hypothetical protein
MLEHVMLVYLALGGTGVSHAMSRRGLRRAASADGVRRDYCGSPRAAAAPAQEQPRVELDRRAYARLPPMRHEKAF